MSTLLLPNDVETKPSSTSLSSRAMTVALHLSAWRATRLDRQTTAEVLDERKAERDAGRFEKNLVPPKALEGVTRAHSHARARHYAMTLPWGDEAVRILSAAAFFDYSAAMAEERTACELAHKEFVEAYPTLLADAPKRLGPKLFQSLDFPTADQIVGKFGFHLVVLPVPEGNDFRVALGTEVEQEIRAQIEETVTERYGTAQRELWERLMDTVKHFAVTMQQEKKIFRNSTVTKLADLARVAPKLSLTPDPKLEEICAEIITLTDAFEPNDLRTDDKARSVAASKARAALADIERAIAGAF
jgi:hypothetical protein